MMVQKHCNYPIMYIKNFKILFFILVFKKCFWFLSNLGILKASMGLWNNHWNTGPCGAQLNIPSPTINPNQDDWCFLGFCSAYYTIKSIQSSLIRSRLPRLLSNEGTLPPSICFFVVLFPDFVGFSLGFLLLFNLLIWFYLEMSLMMLEE